MPFFIVGAPVVASTDELPTGCADVVEGAFAIPNLADVQSVATSFVLLHWTSHLF